MLTLRASANACALSPLEIASGLLSGRDGSVSADEAGPGETPLAALESAVLAGLLRPPCVVSFSGGRDSSVVLAVAARVARREGLPLPLPATNRFPGAAATDESEWQERVIAHLGLTDWVRLEFSDELDIVGPIATRALRRHGLLWPPNAHFHLPLLEAASGGSLLTGIGGDEALDASRWSRASAVLSARVRPEPRDALRVMFAAAPRRARRWALRRRFPVSLTWLQEDARRMARAAWAVQAAEEPLRFGARLRWWRSLRYMQVGLASLDRLAADSDVRINHPLADLRFLAALGATRSFAGYENRAEAMRAVLGDLLPVEVSGRSAKARFDDPFWNRHSREFVRSWSGEGVDLELIDLHALRRVWGSPQPAAGTFTLLQAVWLAREASASTDGELEEPLGGLRERLPGMGAAQLPGG